MSQSAKGLSQILFLIIAAAVLMFVGLIMITAFQGGIIGTGNQADVQACQSAAEVCRVGNKDSFGIPSSCFDDEGNPINNAPSWAQGESPGNRVQCSAISGIS